MSGGDPPAMTETMEEARRILVIANRTCPCELLQDEIRARAQDSPSEVLIVAPALNKRVKHWVSDTDEAVAAAQERLAGTVQSLRECGVDAQGKVGDSVPSHAIEDALVEFPADELIISTHPAPDSHWLENGLLEWAQDAFDGPVAHVVSAYGVEDARPG